MTTIELNPSLIVDDGGLLRPDVYGWLITNVGRGSQGPKITGIDDEWEWCWHWYLRTSKGADRRVPKILILNDSAALLFKLTWGGNG